jgi:signal peptidase I
LLGRLLRIIRVEGDSMVPGLYDGDRLLAVRPGPWRPLRRGRIVVGRVPAMAGGDGSALFIKRVLALPGETARVPLDRLAAGRDAVQFGATIDGTDATWPVPAGHVFVKGDALDSADSVSWGTVPRGELVGVVVGRLLPS